MNNQQNIISRENVINQIPQQDTSGNGIFRTYEFTLTGSNHKHRGNYGDEVALKLHSGDPVTLIFEKNNPYDDRAIRVEWNGKYVGWIPQFVGTWKDPIITRLEKGCTVNAFVTSVRPVSVRTKFEDDEDDEDDEKWGDMLVTTVDIVVVLYDLPNQKKTSDKNKNKDFREPIPQKQESNFTTRGCLGAIVFVGIIFLIAWWLFNNFLSFLGF